MTDTKALLIGSAQGIDKSTLVLKATSHTLSDKEEQACRYENMIFYISVYSDIQLLVYSAAQSLVYSTNTQ